MEELNPSKDCINLHCIRIDTNLKIGRIANLIKNKKDIQEKFLSQKDYFI